MREQYWVPVVDEEFAELMNALRASGLSYEQAVECRAWSVRESKTSLDKQPKDYLKWCVSRAERGEPMPWIDRGLEERLATGKGERRFFVQDTQYDGLNRKQRRALDSQKRHR